MFETTSDFVWQKIQPRPRNAHKGTFGSVLAVAGSASYRGAAALAVEGAGGGETVAAAQVAVVRHQQAHRLDDAGLHLLFGRNRVQRRIIGKERTAGDEDFDLLDHFL